MATWFFVLELEQVGGTQFAVGTEMAPCVLSLKYIPWCVEVSSLLSLALLCSTGPWNYKSVRFRTCLVQLLPTFSKHEGLFYQLKNYEGSNGTGYTFTIHLLEKDEQL